MITIWSLFLWFLENWLLIYWLIGTIAAYIYGGRNLALIVLTLGLAAFMYNKGGKDERNLNNEKVAKVEKKRKNAYNKIENRGTSRNDIVDRLRNNGY